MKAPDHAEPGGRNGRPPDQQVQVRSVTGRAPAGGEFDQGDVLEGAEALPDLGDQAGKGSREQAGECCGSFFLLHLLGRWRLPPEGQDVAKGEGEQILRRLATVSDPLENGAPASCEHAPAGRAAPALAGGKQVLPGLPVAEELRRHAVQTVDPSGPQS